ncbi:PDZ domain-containing protein [Streptomyces sp. V3I7]|uniref:PDZ domain-containing protein n=1 Tax=Streptomyces sp. V3I7 TaxID=3042278 RepID=UPI0027851579|nr:PDZ domain-containing protein [Streptomyces sp. V3I7]MDQ0993684.1 hypothetical protein [Streptomyces sp. V3I7]
MEQQTALRPRPMPGRGPRDGATPGLAATRHPHAARRRGRRLRALVFGLFAGTVLVLSGVGLGTVGATVIGASKLAAVQRRPPPPPQRPAPAPSAAPAPVATATLGVEAVDGEGTGALVIAVHMPGPGYTAGLVRGDVLLYFGRTRIDSAAGLARAVDGARAGEEVTLTLRHRSGGYQQLTVVPGIVT